MFVVQDMVTEVAVLAAVLVVLLLCAFVVATVGREALERRGAHEARRRLRRRVWKEYAAACAPAPADTVAAPARRVPQAGTVPRVARDKSAGLSARPSKA
jgi:hypothetical protein